jgi:pimeloyl-ACP methyl ester carboxylesterase
MWWVIEAVLWSCKGIVFLCLSGFVYQVIKTKRDKKLFPPSGKMIDVDGYRLHINIQGKGKPAVILDSGLGGASLDWALVQPKISEHTLVCSYDRAGIGWSDESSNKRTCQNMVDELHMLLHKAEIPAPYVLVGHSLGGINARLYASKYPNEVSGIVLVDAAHEDQMEKLPPPPGQNKLIKLLTNHRVLQFITYIGIPRLFFSLPSIQKLYDMFPINIRRAIFAKRSTTKYMKTSLKEMSCLKESLMQLKFSSEDLGNIPLVVITAGKEPEGKENGYSQKWIDEQSKIWKELQKELATLSENSTTLVAENSDHMIPYYQPTIIVDAVQEIMKKMHSSSLKQKVFSSGEGTISKDNNSKGIIRLQ